MKPFLNQLNGRLTGLAAGLAVAAFATAASAADISGAGATFPYPIYAKWAEAYKAKTGIGLNYQSIGSGGGIAQIKAKTVTFGASDKPLEPGELDSAGLTQFPTVIGGVVPVVHLSGIAPGQLVLTGKVLADIYQGKLTKWNDPEIKSLNSGANLPDKAIVVVHRSDGSGTSFIFTNYLCKESPGWAKDVGAATAVEWPAGVGAKGNEGVAGNVAQTDGSIGYVEYAYAKQNKLTYVRMMNKSGAAVEPTAAAFQAAAAKADWAHSPGFYVILTDEPGKDAWPIAGATFILVYKNPPSTADTAEALKFFKWAYESGDQLAESLDYVPLPDSVVQQIEKSWHDNIKGVGM
ncbi:MAG TPA: phosphate ABC transporter substrate-binding protein PstS [Rhizomicrobium sp.]|nr:phosphate ABC transporter substrate-binding protein PstS [Rhizomicrobium sp.]